MFDKQPSHSRLMAAVAEGAAESAKLHQAGLPELPNAIHHLFSSHGSRAELSAVGLSLSERNASTTWPQAPFTSLFFSDFEGLPGAAALALDC